MSGTVCQDGMVDGLKFGDPETLGERHQLGISSHPALAGDPAV